MEYKEFLNKNDGYKLVKLPAYAGDDENSGLIEVPEGATSYAKDSMFGREAKYFFKDHAAFIDGMWMRCGFSKPDQYVLWQREDQDAYDATIGDNVNHPSHYTQGGIECIDAIQASMSNEAFCGYLKGNVQKYMWRYENKGGLESLHKAQWYLNKLVQVVGG